MIHVTILGNYILLVRTFAVRLFMFLEQLIKYNKDDVAVIVRVRLYICYWIPSIP